jgi:hypothetical protein
MTTFDFAVVAFPISYPQVHELSPSVLYTTADEGPMASD